MRSDTTLDRALIIFTIVATILIATLHHFTIANLGIIPGIITAQITVTRHIIVALFNFFASFIVLSSNFGIFLRALCVSNRVS